MVLPRLKGCGALVVFYDSARELWSMSLSAVSVSMAWRFYDWTTQRQAFRKLCADSQHVAAAGLA